MIYLFLANGFEESEALVPLDLLRRAGVEVTTVAVGNGGSEIVTGAHGIKVFADNCEELIADNCADGVILPGGMPGTLNLGKSKNVAALVKSCHSRGKMVAAICAAPSVLASLGVLEGKRATCFPGFEDKLTAGGAKAVKEAVVADGNVITGRGMGAAQEFGLAMVGYLCGGDKASALAEAICKP